MYKVAYTPLHYGREYLESAIRSVIDYVDRYVVLYTPVGSCGHHSPEPCPETRDELMQIAMRAAGDKLRWYDGQWPDYGAHNDAIFEIEPDADMLLVLDADEVWHPLLVQHAITVAETAQVRAYRAPIIHFWRSFHRAVLHDPAFPIRIIMPKIKAGEAYLQGLEHGIKPISHFGYAQTEKIVAYKVSIHGHKAEFRTDIDWMAKRFHINAQHDLHPVGSPYWNTEGVNPLDYMPHWMKEHPFFNMEWIP